MKTIILYIVSLSLIYACNPTKKERNTMVVATPEKHQQLVKNIKTVVDTLFTFETDKNGTLPKDWSVSYTGKHGENPHWEIADDKGNKVLAQTTRKNPNYHFNIAIFNDFEIQNMELSVNLKAIKGRMDQGGGFVWRYIDADNYYVVRANPLEDNVVLYKVVDGKRTDLPVIGEGRTYGVTVAPLGKDWNQLGLKVKGQLFSVFLNKKAIFQVEDNTFTQAGKIGLWTKADAQTYFDNYRIKVLQ